MRIRRGMGPGQAEILDSRRALEPAPPPR